MIALAALVRYHGLATIAIALTSLAGHLSGNPHLFTWGSAGVGMALSTSITFLIVGIALFLASMALPDARP